MKKLAVVHYLPLEHYPPVTNFLRFLAKDFYNDYNVRIFTSLNVKGRKKFSLSMFKIYRFPFPVKDENMISRLFKYLSFNLGTLIGLLVHKPTHILYYESYSAWPVYWYLKLRKGNCNLFVHYHEYSDPDWYKNGMRLVRNYYKKEKSYLWKKASWISQTNEARLSLFKTDYPFLNEKVLQVLPNYPPQSWSANGGEFNNSKILRTVYIGSLSLSDTYLKEYCNWIEDQEGEVSFTIFSYNMDQETKVFLENRSKKYFKIIYEGVEYDQIPKILEDFHVGLILYKPHSLNVINCAPNKLFEYYACGLDVWYPKQIKGCDNYQTNSTIPKVIPIDFSYLNNQTKNFFKNRSNLAFEQKEYCAEKVNTDLMNFLLST